MFIEFKNTTHPFQNNMLNDWFYELAFKRLNIYDKPINELGVDYVYTNRYDNVSIDKVINISELFEDEEVLEHRFYEAKHGRTMTQAERSYLIHKIDKIFFSKTLITTHAQEKTNKRKVSDHAIYKCMKNYSIVEYRAVFDDYNNLEDRRVTLMSIQTGHCKKGHYVYIALSLDLGKIITVYQDTVNKYSTEYTNEIEKYNDSLDILNVERKPIGKRLYEHEIFIKNKEYYKKHGRNLTSLF